VKAFSQEQREQDRFYRRASDGMLARVRLAMAGAQYSLAVGTVIGAGGAAVLFVGVRQVQHGRMTLGDLLLIMGYLAQLYAPVKTISKNAGNLQKNLASAERAFGLLDEAPEVHERPGARRIGRAAGAVTFRDVCFAWEPGRPALNGVSLAVHPGTRVGIAGETGGAS
jgi:ATP-binding cassette subfamily B protein